MDFLNLYAHGFIRAASCVPELKVADPAFNVVRTIELIEAAAEKNSVLAIFPELGLSGYTCQDLFFQESLLAAVEAALCELQEKTAGIGMPFVVGAPLKIDDALFNCGIVMQRGRILGVAVKSYIPNQREFYELRHFAPASELLSSEMDLCGQRVPVGADLIFNAKNIPGFSFYIELCEDLWTPVPPSSFAALAGATVIGNLSASNITVGKDEYRHALVGNQAARTLSAYIYTAAGYGESTTDLAWDGHALISENGRLLAESQRFAWQPQLVTADIDLERLTQDRMRTTSFAASRREHIARVRGFRTVDLEIEVPRGKVELQREIERFPYVPADPNLRDKRCYEVYNIQVQGLYKRMQAAGFKKLVIGISGGLDSTQALIVCARTMDALGLPRENIKAYTMPGFATSDKTYQNALDLMKSLGVDLNEIDIRPSCKQMMADIEHPFVDGAEQYDITFENVQAGERTSHLFRLANQHDAMVVGTGDLSELALGWCTYGVGDHMSHYSVNASVPKTLIQYLIRWVAAKDFFGSEASDTLIDILNTEISPELVPGKSGDEPQQRTEDKIGPYELQDFNTYYTTRLGYRPTKIAYLAYNAWRDVEAGHWPDVPEEKRNGYDLATIKQWLGTFIWRFFKVSQFKRSCVPDSPKVGSGGSLSPRGDYRAPSDGEMSAWMADWERIPEDV